MKDTFRKREILRKGMRIEVGRDLLKLSKVGVLQGPPCPPGVLRQGNAKTIQTSKGRGKE